jgi:hypothetical protein
MKEVRKHIWALQDCGPTLRFVILHEERNHAIDQPRWLIVWYDIV